MLNSADGARTFHWLSSAVGDRSELDRLSATMDAFYRDPATRVRYQSLADSDVARQPQTEYALCKAVLERKPGSVVEIGCGSGRLYRALVAAGFSAAYTGVEMSAELIAHNAERMPEATWVAGSVYDLALPSQSVDLVYSYFVLEHCVYPEKALQRMIDLLKPGGAAILVFPDFVEMGRFGSQALGLKGGGTKAALKRWELVNACVSLYDARVRLPRALRTASARCGPFPVNTRPRCVRDDNQLEPDCDAVYMSSRSEVATGATDRGLRVMFPAGITGHFLHNVLIELVRE